MAQTQTRAITLAEMMALLMKKRPKPGTSATAL